MKDYRTLRDTVTGEERGDLIMRTADGAHIPADPLNVDWQAYQAWLAAGNTPDEPEASTPPDDAASAA